MKKMNTTKKVYGLISFILLITMMGLSACSNSINNVIDEDDLPADSLGSRVSFELGMAEYADGNNEDAAQSVASAKAMSRASAQETNGKVVSSTTEDLGNGLEALVEVKETHTEKAATRAPGLAPAGRYTILAYQGNELKAKWEIQYSSPVYVMINGSKKEQYMTPGTYTFYVFNNNLAFENGKIVAKLNTNAREAFYLSEQVTIQNKRKTKLDFVLKPFFSRVYFKMKAFTTSVFEGSMTGSFVYGASAIPESIAIDPKTGNVERTLNSTAGEMLFSGFDGNFSVGENAYNRSSTPKYLLPGTDITKLKFRFSSTSTGTIYKKAIAGKTLTISNPIAGGLQGGTEYTIVVTIYYSATYLFSDGTTGTMGNKGNRTPVALVVGKDNKSRNVAIALKDVSSAIAWTSNGSYTCKKWYHNKINEAIDAYDGEEQTYEGSTTWTPRNSIKADLPDFTAFFQTSRYNPGVTLTGSLVNKRWFLGGLGEWSLATKAMGANSLKDRNVKTDYPYESGLKYQLIRILFQQAGGSPIDGYYWTADCSDDKPFTVMFRSNNVNVNQINYAVKTSSSGAARAFIHF